MVKKVKIKKKIIHIRDLLLVWNTPETRLRPGVREAAAGPLIPCVLMNSMTPPPRPRMSVSVSFFSFDWTRRKEPERVFPPG